MDPQLQLFYRQYHQQFLPLAYPPGTLLKEPDIQSTLELHFFNSTNLTNIPIFYQAKTLDRIIALITAAVKDPEDELGVSDLLYQRRAELASLSSPSNTVSVSLTKSVSIYHAPSPLSSSTPSLRINEAKNIIGSGPNTGLRTWEASLRLATYLHSKPCLIQDRTILELGAGTGFLSLFCALSLHPRLVVATDGHEEVLDGLRSNIALSRAVLEEQGSLVPVVRKLLWEDDEDLQSALQLDAQEQDHPQYDSSSNNNVGKNPPSSLFSQLNPDLILGADITYHPCSLPSLTSLLFKLLSLNPASTSSRTPPKVLISATHRSPQTLSYFLEQCASHNLNVTEINYDAPSMHEQKGLFHNISMEIHIFEITLISTLNSKPHGTTAADRATDVEGTNA